eukprot:TRINITY_DN46400_c0_g1_i1.p1 TRINITY_DN46400_c0_g1~~TRINITY_DN46400_c0_g1_i1.p1  ORF type:complete len:789 (-),score=167.37 TRINITY_DN46400_c0_g1_i1:77-2443(-)
MAGQFALGHQEGSRGAPPDAAHGTGPMQRSVPTLQLPGVQAAGTGLTGPGGLKPGLMRGPGGPPSAPTGAAPGGIPPGAQNQGTMQQRGMQHQMQAGVQYMPCIVPIDQWHATQMTSGAVAIGQVSAAQLQNGMMPQMQLPGGVVPLGHMQGAEQQQWGPGGKGSGKGDRPTRGRSPPKTGGYNRGGPSSGAPGEKPERDWAALRRALPQPDAGGARTDPPARPGLSGAGGLGRPPAQASDANGQPGPAKENVWRPSILGDPEAQKNAEIRHPIERRESAERRKSPPRHGGKSPTRQGGHSPGRGFGGGGAGIPRPGSPGASGRPRSPFGGNRPRSPFRSSSNGPGHYQAQKSERWLQTLPSRDTVQVSLIADAQALQQAAHQMSFLDFLGPDAMTAVAVQGIKLGTAAGRLCLVQVAFRDGAGLQCLLFDAVQLGAQQLQSALSPFLQNQNAAKIVHDAHQTATVLAHKFGISLAGAIDAQWAYETLSKTPYAPLTEVLNYCGMATPSSNEEMAKLDRTPEVWSQRPLARSVLTIAAQAACALHAAGPVLWQRLYWMLGPSANHMVAGASQQRVVMAAAAGFACRKAGLWTADPKPDAVDHADNDNEFDDWLARRFRGEKAASQGAAAALRAKSSENRPAPLPFGVVKAGDSPRTASWRAAMAQLDPSGRLLQRTGARGARQRSSSPSLDNWLERRTKLKGDEAEDERPYRRARSMPARHEEEEEDEQEREARAHRLRQPLEPVVDVDHRAWAELLEEEQEEDDNEDVFVQLKKEERKRQNQAEKGL